MGIFLITDWIDCMMTGNDISCKLDIEVQPDASAPAVRYLRGGRELKNDSRTKITTQGNKSTMMIRRSRFTDEAKYTAILEQDGVQVDEATWSVFVKGKFLWTIYFIFYAIIKSPEEVFSLMFEFSALLMKGT